MECGNLDGILEQKIPLGKNDGNLKKTIDFSY
jgi:hypothetical protein